ncbi:MAG: tetratricopeptide repeat protein [Thermohalobaculum sp.]
MPQEPEPEIDPLLAKPDRKIRGRGADIERIDRAFKDRGDLPAVAVTGPGGYGKTALAGEYARRRARRYRGVWLVDATSLGEARNSLSRLGARLGIAVPDNVAEGIDCVLKELKARGGRWLLVHDNIDDPARLGELQHQLQHPDCIDHLVTSRVADWTGKAETVPLDVLPGDEAVALLAAESGREGETGLAEMATQVLDRHPLALVVAGQTLRHNREVSVAELSGRFHERLKVAPESETYGKSLYVAVEESLARLDPDAKALLKLAAFLSPDDIAPEYLVDAAEAIAAREWLPLPEPLASLATDAMRRGDAFAACQGNSLLSDAEWAGPDGKRHLTNSIHRLTQAVLRDWMGAEAQAQMIGLAARLGSAQFSDDPQYDVPAWPCCHRLAPHGRALAPLAVGAAGNDRKIAAGFAHETALFLRYATGDIAEARRLYESNLPVVAAAYGAESDDYAAALGNLALALDLLGEDAAAERHYREAIAVREAATEESDPRRAYLRNNLGGFYSRRKRFAEAETEYQTARDILVAAFGEQGELVGGSYGNLGALYSDWADNTGDAALRQQALENKRKGLEITRAALGPLHFSTATRHHNLAKDLALTGAEKDAAMHQLRAAAIPLAMARAGMIAQDHPQVAEMRAPLEHYFRETGRAADIPRLGELLDAEVAAVLTEHAEWQAAQDAPPAPEA